MNLQIKREGVDFYTLLLKTIVKKKKLAIKLDEKLIANGAV